MWITAFEQLIDSSKSLMCIDLTQITIYSGTKNQYFQRKI